jgi:hypothetical protein
LGATGLGSTATAIQSIETPARLNPDSDQIFAGMAEMDLLQRRMDVIDEIVTADLALFRNAFEYMSMTEAVHSLDDDSESSFTESDETEAIREGFIDIGEAVDELLGRESTAAESENHDPDDLDPDSAVSSNAGNVERDDIAFDDSWWLFAASLDDDHAFPAADTTIQGLSAPQAMREGMIELAHSDVSQVAGAEDQVDGGEPADADASVLKMDGSVVRYQAFEIAPVPDPGNGRTQPSDYGVPSEQPLSDNISNEPGDRGHTAARASLAPALLSLFFGRRKRHRRGADQ